MHEKVREEWAVLIAAMRNAMNRQFSPRDQVVQELARHWIDLLRRTGMEDPDMLPDYDGTRLLEPGYRPQNGIDIELFGYMSAALWAKHLSLDESKRLRTDGPKQREWPRLLSALRDHMNHGAGVASPAVQQLYAQWESGQDELTAGDGDLRRKWLTAVRSDPALLVGAGVDTRLQNYLRRAHLAKDGWAA